MEIKNTNQLTDHQAYKCKACQKGNPKNCTELSTYHIRVREKYAILWPIIGIICEIIFICLIIIIYEWNGPGYSNSREEICEEGTVNLNGGPHRGPVRGGAEGSPVDTGGAGGTRPPPEFEGSEEGQSLISAYRSLAITMKTPGLKKLSTALEGDLAQPEFGDSGKRTERDNLSQPGPLD